MQIVDQNLVRNFSFIIYYFYLKLRPIISLRLKLFFLLSTQRSGEDRRHTWESKRDRSVERGKKN